MIEGNGISLIEKLKEKEKEQNYFFYIDPPYFKAGKVLYRDYFNEDEHVELSNVVKSLTSPWLVSYDENDFIYNLYNGSENQYVFTDYQAGYLRRDVREMLFSNLKIPPIKDTYKENAGYTNKDVIIQEA